MSRRCLGYCFLFAASASCSIFVRPLCHFYWILPKMMIPWLRDVRFSQDNCCETHCATLLLLFPVSALSLSQTYATRLTFTIRLTPVLSVSLRARLDQNFFMCSQFSLLSKFWRKPADSHWLVFTNTRILQEIQNFPCYFPVCHRFFFCFHLNTLKNNSI